MFAALQASTLKCLRGYLYRLAVHPAFRNHGFGAALVESCLGSLRGVGVLRCHVMVYREKRWRARIADIQAALAYAAWRTQETELPLP